jgi:hypothetical protein
MKKDRNIFLEIVFSQRNQVFSSPNAPRYHEITIWEKPPVFRTLAQRSSLEKQVRVEKEKENNYYSKTPLL